MLRRRPKKDDARSVKMPLTPFRAGHEQLLMGSRMVRDAFSDFIPYGKPRSGFNGAC